MKSAISLCAMSLGFLCFGDAWAQSLSVPQTHEEFSFDRTQYAQLVLTSDGGGNVFEGSCPEDEEKEGTFLGVSDIGDIFSGRRAQTASLTVRVQMPRGEHETAIELLELQRTQRQRLPPRERICTVKTREITLISPIFAMSEYENTVFEVSVELLRRDSTSESPFAIGYQAVMGESQRFSFVPAAAMRIVQEVFPSQLDGNETVDSIINLQDSRQLAITDLVSGTRQEEWRVPGAVWNLPADITLTARLVNQEYLFTRDNASWNPASILSRSFYARDTGESLNVERFLIQNFDQAYGRFSTADSLAEFDGLCGNMLDYIDRMGLTARDRSVLGWALIRSHDLSIDPRIDHTDCAKRAWINLPKDANGSEYPEFQQRAVFETRAATPLEINGLLNDTSDRFEVFFEAAEPSARQRAGAFAVPGEINYVDSAGIDLLRTDNAVLHGPGDWMIWQRNPNLSLASNIGFYAFNDNALEGEQPFIDGRAYGFGRWITGPNGEPTEAVFAIDVVYDEETTNNPIRISRFELVADPDSEVVNRIASLNERRINRRLASGDWVPELLLPPDTQEVDPGEQVDQ